MNTNHYNLTASSMLLLTCVFVTAEAHANFNDILCSAVGLITGQAGAAIATAAVLILGVGAILGRIQWGQAVLFAAGIGAIFGAPAILNAIGADACTVGGAAGGPAGGGAGGYTYFWHMR